MVLKHKGIKQNDGQSPEEFERPMELRHGSGESKGKILIVDRDLNPFLMDTLKREMPNVEVIFSNNVTDGWFNFETQRPDIVLIHFTTPQET